MRHVFEVYQPAATTKARYRILYGGSNSGKSVFVAQDETWRVWNDPRQRLLVIRKVRTDIRHSTHRLFLDIFDAMEASHLVKRRDLDFELPGGGQIIHVGLDDVARLKSIAGITRIWFEEATEADFNKPGKEPDLAQLDLRLRGVPRGITPQITYTFNPKRVAERIFEYVDFPLSDLPASSHVERDNVYVQHTTYKDNLRARAEDIAVYEALGPGMRAVYERGEIADVDVQGALWNRDMIAGKMRAARLPAGVELVRIVVAIDPPGNTAECGIIVAGLGTGGNGYLLEDCSMAGSPAEWGTAAVAALNRWRADRIIAEVNQGGTMVEHTIRTVPGGKNAPYKTVWAARGKQTRAEPVSALGEAGNIKHVGYFKLLEDQMCSWVPGMKSPDRLDAYVWAFTDLLPLAQTITASAEQLPL